MAVAIWRRLPSAQTVGAQSHSHFQPDVFPLHQLPHDSSRDQGPAGPASSSGGSDSGFFVLGRQSALGIADARCSRRQVLLRVQGVLPTSSATVRVFARRVGINASFLHRAIRASRSARGTTSDDSGDTRVTDSLQVPELLALCKHSTGAQEHCPDEVELFNGDCLTLVGPEACPISVVLEGPDGSSTAPLVPPAFLQKILSEQSMQFHIDPGPAIRSATNTSSISAPPDGVEPQHPRKRLRVESESLHPSNDSVACSTLVSRPDTRPLCRFGSMCYRQSPEHLRDFRHDTSSEVNTAPTTASVSVDWPENGLYALGFPSLSTGIYQFDPQIAGEVLARETVEFLRRHRDPRIRLLCCDLNAWSEPLCALREAYATLSHEDDARFVIAGADITRLNSRHCRPCRVIVNPANPRLSSNGSGVNVAIYERAGPNHPADVHALLRARFPGQSNLTPSQVLAVPLSADSPLASEELCSHVIHVVAPNMNPQRPRCLNGDYILGREQLHKSYKSVFDEFAQIIGLYGHVRPEIRLAPIFERPDTQTPRGAAVSRDMEQKPNRSHARAHTGAGFASLLAPYILHPEQHQEDIYFRNDAVTVIHDKFPKAKVHLLVMPSQLVPGFSVLTHAYVPMVRNMVQESRRIVQELAKKYPTLKFRCGFHRVPSMT